jgi:hypothetical protein
MINLLLSFYVQDMDNVSAASLDALEVMMGSNKGLKIYQITNRIISNFFIK